jgi:hypothetical protein
MIKASFLMSFGLFDGDSTHCVIMVCFHFSIIIKNDISFLAGGALCDDFLVFRHYNFKTICLLLVITEKTKS